MNPKTIAEVFRQGHATRDEAVASFLCCAEEMEPHLLVKEIPHEFLNEFEQEVRELPDGEDIPIIGTHVLLSKDTIQRLKAFLRNKCQSRM